MDNAARIRQRVLAIFLPVTAVLYIGGEALSPKGTDQVITTTATALKVLPIAARHPAQLYVAGGRAWSPAWCWSGRSSATPGQARCSAS